MNNPAFPQPVAGPFSGTNGVDPSNKLPKFPPDFSGRLRIDVCKYITSRDGDQAFIVEFTPLTSNLSSVVIGGRYSWYQSMRERGTAYAAAIGFLYAALGLDANRDRAEIDANVKPNQDNYLNLAVSPQQPLTGQEVHLQTRGIITEKKKQPFTVHTFSAVAKSA